MVKFIELSVKFVKLNYMPISQIVKTTLHYTLQINVWFGLVDFNHFKLRDLEININNMICTK